MSSSSSRSAGTTNFIGLLNDDQLSLPSHQRSTGTAPRRSSLDTLHALAAFLPDDLLCDDPLLDMPIMTIDDNNTDEYFESTISELKHTSTSTPTATTKSKRRPSTDAFMAFHKMMEFTPIEDGDYGHFGGCTTFDSSFSSSARNESMSSFTTACETSQRFASPTAAASIAAANQLAISKSFAASMLKSSQSREQLDYMQRQVMMQQQGSTGSVIVPSTPITTRRASSIPTTPQKRVRQLNPDTVTSAAQFLTGKRPTLTAALEESRKRLKAYQDKLGCSTY